MPRTKYATDEERITRNVVAAPSGCWEWQGRLTEKGYGRLNVGGRVFRAHRFSYELFVGPVPPGLTVDHLCRVRHCVNPEHLEAVTQAENVHRSPLTIPSINVKKTHCAKNHAFDDANTYISPLGQRVCRQCRNASVARSKTRKAFAAANVVQDVAA